MSLFGLDEAKKVFLYSKSTDVRKGFDGLYRLVLDAMELNPRCGNLFVFMNFDRSNFEII